MCATTPSCRRALASTHRASYVGGKAASTASASARLHGLGNLAEELKHQGLIIERFAQAEVPRPGLRSTSSSYILTASWSSSLRKAVSPAALISGARPDAVDELPPGAD